MPWAGPFLEEPLDAAGARRELGLPEDGHYIGTVSSLVAYEGLDDLVRAFALLAPNFPQLRLLIVGDGVAGPALKEQVRPWDWPTRSFHRPGAARPGPALPPGPGRLCGPP